MYYKFHDSSVLALNTAISHGVIYCCLLSLLCMYIQFYAILLVCVELALPMTRVAALRDTLGNDVLKQV